MLNYEKTLSENACKSSDAIREYELNEDSVVINFADNLELNERVLMTLTYSFDMNFNVSKLSINNSEKILYEAVFGEIVE